VLPSSFSKKTRGPRLADFLEIPVNLIRSDDAPHKGRSSQKHCDLVVARDVRDHADAHSRWSPQGKQVMKVPGSLSVAGMLFQSDEAQA
jgi:hypothetical protein